MRRDFLVVALAFFVLAAPARAETAKLLEKELSPAVQSGDEIKLGMPHDLGVSGSLRGNQWGCYAACGGALIPGLGQFMNGEPVKGGAILGGFLVAGIIFKAFTPKEQGADLPIGLEILAVPFAVLYVWSIWDAYITAVRSG